MPKLHPASPKQNWPTSSNAKQCPHSRESSPDGTSATCSETVCACCPKTLAALEHHCEKARQATQDRQEQAGWFSPPGPQRLSRKSKRPKTKRCERLWTGSRKRNQYRRE